DSGAAPYGVRPTAAGTDITAASVTLAGGLFIDVNGTTSDSGYSRLVVSGDVVCSAVDMFLKIGTGKDGLVGNVYTVVSAANVIGAFANLPDGGTIAGTTYQYQASYSPTAVTLTALPIADA